MREPFFALPLLLCRTRLPKGHAAAIYPSQLGLELIMPISFEDEEGADCSPELVLARGPWVVPTPRIGALAQCQAVGSDEINGPVRMGAWVFRVCPPQR